MGIFNLALGDTFFNKKPGGKEGSYEQRTNWVLYSWRN